MLQKINHTKEAKAVKELDYTAWRKSSYNHLKFQGDFASYSSVLSAMLQSASSLSKHDRQCNIADHLKNVANWLPYTHGLLHSWSM